MKKTLGSWSGMRKYLEQEMLAESLRGRVRYGCTSYAGMDGWCIFEICFDGIQMKRFSLETLNTYFIDNGYKEVAVKPFGKMEYWREFWYLYNEIPLQSRTEYTDEEFCDALKEYRNQKIQVSIHSENPLVRMFAVLDKRLGKNSLKKVKDTIADQPEWLQSFYRLRMDSELICNVQQ